MRKLEPFDVRGVIVATAATRPGDRRGTSRDLLAVLSGAAVEWITAEPCAHCGRPHGRPRTPFGSASASHSGGRTVVAFAPPGVTAGPIGVDIEDAADADAQLGGLATLLGSDFPTAVVALRRWTEIEAVLKADGRGLDVDPRSVRVEDSAGSRLAWVDDRPLARYEIDALPLGPLLVGSLARPYAER